MEDNEIIDLIHKLNNKTCVAIGRAEMIDTQKFDIDTNLAFEAIKRNLYDIDKILKKFRAKLPLV